jgi:hypothetical protein
MITVLLSQVLKWTFNNVSLETLKLVEGLWDKIQDGNFARH